MKLYALDDLDDAFAATRRLLTPLRVRTWLKLAVVVLFLGGAGGNASPFSYSANTGDEFEPPPDPGVAEPTAVAVVVAVVVALVLLAGLFFVVAGVMEFVFVESLRSREVTIRRYWGRRWRQGVRLALFRIALWVVAGLVVAAMVAVGLLPFFLGDGGPVSVLVLLVLAPVFLVVTVLFALVDGFTRAFVVPVMVVEDCGVIRGWRRFWPTVTRNPGQYLAYVVVVFLLSLVFGVVVGILGAVVALVLLIPFSIPFLAGVVLLEGSTAVGVAVLVVTGVVFGLVLAVAVAVVRVPFATYSRYLSLLVLGDVAPDLDPVREVRSAVRSRHEASTEGDAGDAPPGGE